MRDMHNNIKVLAAIVPQAVGTTGAANGQLGAVIDRQGFESLEFTFQAGPTGTAGDRVHPGVLESDASNGSFTSVADADLLGDESPLTGAGGIGKVGYVGAKRYARLRLYGVGTATAIVSAQAVLGNPNLAPVA